MTDAFTTDAFTLEEAQAAFLDLLRIPSVTGDELPAVEYLEGILDRYGVEYHRIAKTPQRPNLLAALRAETPEKPPLLLISHIDVVDGDEAKWDYPVFGGVVDDGRIYARGTLDTKQLTLMELYAFLQLVDQPRNRDVYFLATADEEGGSEYGMAYVKEVRPELFSGAIVLNEGGGFPLHINGQDYITLTVGEKGVFKLRLWADGQGGHASSPGDDQAIQKLAEGLKRIFAAEADLNLGSRAVRHAMEAILDGATPEAGSVAANIYGYAGSCSIGMRDYKIGQRSNVLPTRAEAELDFKVLPGATEREILDFVARHLADTEVKYELLDSQPGFENGEAQWRRTAWRLEAACAKQGAPMAALPMLALGRTDGRFFGSAGSQVYGCSPVLPEDGFEATLPKVHGHNESISQASFAFGCAVVRQMVEEACLATKTT